MAFCVNCGAVLIQETGFCASCGKPVGSSDRTSAPGPQPVSTIGSSLAPNMAGALAYLLGPVTGIAFLVLEPYKNERFVRFHAMQSILLFAAWIVLGIVGTIAWGVVLTVGQDYRFLTLVDIPVRLFPLLMFLLWLFAMYQAYRQREFHLPLIGAMASKAS